MTIREIPLILALLSLLAAPVGAETYHYEGDDGAVVFTDDAAKIPKKKGKVKKIPDTGMSYTAPVTAGPAAPPQGTNHGNARSEGPVISRQNSYYDVGGYTFKQILREIWRSSPYWAIGNRAAIGWCGWNVSWTLTTRQDGKFCRISSVSTAVPISITMARWKNYASADAGMKEAWDTYYGEVLAHEERHAGHGVEAATEINRRLADLPARYSCKDLREDAELLARRIVRKHREKDVELDRVEGSDFDIITDVDRIADKRDGVVGRQYFDRRDGRR